MNGPGNLPSSFPEETSVAPSAVTPSPDDTSLSPVRVEASPSTVEPAPTVSTAGSGLLTTPPSFPYRVYSPSETANWLTCPVYRQFKKHWQPREVEWEPARLLGIAVQAGINVWLKETDRDEAAIERVVSETLRRGFIEQPKYTLQGLIKLALRGVEATLDANLFDRHQVLMVDESLSHSRPDVVSRHETEGLGVTDFKVSQRVDERFRTKRLSEYETDDQFWHYAWEVGETLGEPVKWIRAILVILSPKVTVLPTVTSIDPDRLNYWLSGGEQHWRDMTAEDRGERVIAPRWPSCRSGKFGVCEAYDYCHVFNRDATKATVYYERIDH